MMRNVPFVCKIEQLQRAMELSEKGAYYGQYGDLPNYFCGYDYSIL